MPTKDGKLGVAIAGLGWCGAQHAEAFLKNPNCAVTWVYGRDEGRVRANIEKYKLTLPAVSQVIGPVVQYRIPKIAATKVEVVALISKEILQQLESK